MFAQAVPIVEGVTTTTTTIAGTDGNDVTLYVSRPDDADGALPCVVHLHGGGMAFLSAADTGYMRGREYLAATGLVVVGVEFRNSGGKLGPYPYPAGSERLRGRGPMGGGQPRGARRCPFDRVRGIRRRQSHPRCCRTRLSGRGGCTRSPVFYAQCPFISNRWLEQPDDLPSLRENDEYFFSCLGLALMGSIYDPDGSHAHDATCWPLAATDEELSGLPPHVISVNELDPLRDEGLLYYRRLVHAGVPAVGRVVAGTCHGGDLLLAGAMPEVYAASMRDVSGFAKSLG